MSQPIDKEQKTTMDKENTPPSGDYCWTTGHTGGWGCPECATPELKELTFGPVTFYQRGPMLRIIWKSGSQVDPGITGHVLSLDELEQLEALIQLARNAQPKLSTE